MEEIEFEGAAEGYIEVFNRCAVDYVFCSPGSEFVPIWEYLTKYNSQGKKPYYINVRHEGLALTMAKGYTMATGRPQVVLTHVISGLLHGAMELKALYTDRIPLMLIVGANRTHENEIYGGTPGPHYLSFTEVGGQQRLVQPYVKWTDTPATNLNILGKMFRAFDIASSEVKGPVLLVLSRELMFEKTGKMRIPSRTSTPTSIQADSRALNKLARLLLEADNPILYTRYLGRNPQAVSHLIELAEMLSIPVFETPGYMNFPTDHPLHQGYSIKPRLNEADLILVVDSSAWPPWYPPSSVLDSNRAKIVFIDVDPLQLKYPVYGYPTDLTITADTSLALPTLVDILKQKLVKRDRSDVINDRYNRWKDKHENIRNSWKREALDAKDECPIDPKWLCYTINEIIDENFITVNETITHGNVIHRYVERNRVRTGTHFESTGPVAHTGLGQGLGVALGAKLAEPEKTVIALVGDGSFNYNPVPACFGLAQEYSLPFIVVIFNNQGYAAMKQHAKYFPEGWSVKHNRYYGVYTKPKPHYEKIAEAFDGYGETVEDPSDVKPALLRALSQVKKEKLALLDVILEE